MNCVIPSNEKISVETSSPSAMPIVKHYLSPENMISFSKKKTKSLEFISKSLLNVNVSNSPQKKKTNGDCYIAIWGINFNNYYQNYEEINQLHNPSLNDTNGRELKVKMQSMKEIIQGENQSFHSQEKEFLQNLEEKTQEIEDLLISRKFDYHLQSMKLSLSVFLHLLDHLKYHPNVEITKLQEERTRFYNFLKDFEEKCRNYPESSSIMVLFEKIIKFLEKYMSGYKTEENILSFSSEDNLKCIDINRKLNESNSFIESPKTVGLHTRIIKKAKYGNLKVQTKNLEEFRDFGKKNVCKENFLMIISVIFVFFMTIIFFLLGVYYFIL